MTQSNRSTVVLAVAGAFIAVLVIVAGVLALQPPPTFEAGTPEATVQSFFEAVNDGDQDLAESFVSEDLLEVCGDTHWYIDDQTVSRVVITDSLVDGDTARIDVTMKISYGGDPFMGNGYDDRERFKLARLGGEWLITDPVWPMDRWGCGERG